MVITVFYLLSVFLSFKMGDNVKSVEDNVSQNSIFYYDLEEVEFSYAKTQTLRFEGKSPLRYAYFNFDKDKLYSYTFVFDRKLISQYSIVLGVKEKFGDATVVTPFDYIWDVGDSIVVLSSNILRMTLKSYVNKES
ncbi:Hypothetical protein BHY_0707 [Borrelia nietonii YOR]|uniref:Uncharacterized protein n=1 Tax=Borrelia nietonii YOR TaxID=1293576 RepID=A0ABM5PHW8_9SPIR|nr:MULTISPECIES: hypothetical protein [Borrelia]AHH03658.1 Hypothetical protein BHY_0707 [Borrelia nietonii YOR]AHH14157.1 Hypothetical protein BHW_0049300 [Borrelia hermsii MTW]UPA09350.1 hypothetical protein bhYOR_000666 [Borrelia nietonii YOR]